MRYHICLLVCRLPAACAAVAVTLRLARVISVGRDARANVTANKAHVSRLVSHDNFPSIPQEAESRHQSTGPSAHPKITGTIQATTIPKEKVISCTLHFSTQRTKSTARTNV